MRDVRMRGFATRTEVVEVLRILGERLASLPAESIKLTEAAGRVLAREAHAPLDVPGFHRAAMDGYALRGSATFGADLYTPLEFEVIGQALPARPYVGSIGSGQAVRIMTGAPLPEGTDAIVPAEAAAEVNGRVAISEAVPPGRHVGLKGEDIQAGSVVLPSNRVLRPQDLGVLASLGISDVAVTRRPRVAVFVTGDELLPVGSKPAGYQIVDSNSIMLAALCRRDGAAEVRVTMLKDQREDLRAAIDGAHEDLLLVSGGSSVGIEDHAPGVIAELGTLSVHGVALRPASPTGLGFVRERPVFLVPGNPVSCLCAYDLFIGGAVRRLGGRSAESPYRVRQAPLARKISSMVGRVDYVRVMLRHGWVEPIATSGASALSSTTRADGYVLVPGDLEGYPDGATVEVHCYDA